MTHLPAAFLLALIVAVVIHAAALIQDTAEGFCLQLDPCHTAQENDR